MGEEALFLGQVVDDRFALHEPIGEGGFSFVFRATDLRSGKPVAVKVLRVNIRTAAPGAESEFENEARLLHQLAGAANVVNLHAAQSEATLLVSPTGSDVQVPLSYLYFAMEWMEDGDLAQLLPLRDHLSWTARIAIFRDVVKGVQQMHRKHIYHRDLKATNVLLRAERSTTFVAKVSDLGRSRNARQPKGAPDGAYMFGRGDGNHRPPECVFGVGGTAESDFLRGDLYLLGSLLFELATGNPLTRTAMLRPWVQLAPPEGSMDPLTLYLWNIPQIRALFHDVLADFDDTLPKCLRPRGGKLIRQLCDADPPMREPRVRHKKVAGPGLDWLINELDVLSRILKHQSGGPTVQKRRRASA